MFRGQGYDFGLSALDDQRVATDQDRAYLCPVHRYECGNEILRATHPEVLDLELERARGVVELPFRNLPRRRLSWVSQNAHAREDRYGFLE